MTTKQRHRVFTDEQWEKIEPLRRGKLQGDESIERVRVFLRDTVGIDADSETARRLVNALLTGG
ncbi:hypothetical protein GCM10009690_26060 [Brevibacterium permense]|uniref:Transposase n=1 Tax=Brevibacterium permense TaxID=234834 RepID=A0ABN2ALG4_9MICO